MRLDLMLVERGFVETRSRAHDLVRRGQVLVAGRKMLRPGVEVSVADAIEVLETTQYVARSALKLVAGLDHFGFSPNGLACLDIGSSTGGFTQVLLERRAALVYAVDVGRSQLHAALRKRPDVIAMEKTDARSLTRASFGSAIEAVTCDVSFISAMKALPAILDIPVKGAWMVILVKPQFEVGRALIGKGGLVKDEAAKQAAVARVSAFVIEAGWKPLGAIPSPLTGQDGNEETLAGFVREA